MLFDATDEKNVSSVPKILPVCAAACSLAEYEPDMNVPKTIFVISFNVISELNLLRRSASTAKLNY